MQTQMILEHPDFLERIPKTDLHLHLDGSLRLNTVRELGREQGVQFPIHGEEDLRTKLICADACESLEEYLEAFDITLSVLQEPEAVRRAAREVVEDAAGQNVRYIEVRFSPILHLQHGRTKAEILDAVLAGLDDGSRATGVQTGAIVCGMRNIDPRLSAELADLAVAYKGKGVVAFDLAGAEANYPAKDHLQAFYKILNNNVNCTCHAGEGFGPESIHQAIHYAGAHRIGHGTRLREDPDLMAYVNDHRIPLEVCLTSNLQTGVTSSLKLHPFRFYYDLGLRVTLNTDNTLMSDTNITREYRLAVENFALDLSDVRRIAIYGFKSAFLPLPKKVALITRMVREIDELIAEVFGAGAVPPPDQH
jgi:adenosine deaminase